MSSIIGLARKDILHTKKNIYEYQQVEKVIPKFVCAYLMLAATKKTTP
jgi:hypothetical protein